jgi:hypothetical protein
VSSIFFQCDRTLPIPLKIPIGRSCQQSFVVGREKERRKERKAFRCCGAEAEQPVARALFSFFVCSFSCQSLPAPRAQNPGAVNENRKKKK